MTDELEDQMLALSAELTGLTRLELQANGMAGAYLGEMRRAAGTARVEALLARGDALIREYGSDPPALKQAIQEQVLADPELGPLARNLIFLWYLGSWNQLPSAWRDRFGASAADADRVVSAEAYKAGLLWTAAGTHPQGANQPGYASWALPPNLGDEANPAGAWALNGVGYAVVRAAHGKATGEVTTGEVMAGEEAAR
jgi:hypothetical protein